MSGTVQPVAHHYNPGLHCCVDVDLMTCTLLLLHRAYRCKYKIF